MASLIPGFEYDVFISYRQKDNKGERWVTSFVEALVTELESTFKEEISVYFDVNPHDGLLETHDVDASLSKKLKCLVFIPVISRIYCDSNSFAWEHEFKAFVNQSAKDQFGLKISLPNGNVINRVLPVRIHELDIADIKLCESVLGGVMRGVEFVYKSSGVNRPLRPIEEHPNDNLNKTYYRDQINKVANSLRDIIQAMSQRGQSVQPVMSSEKVKISGSEKKFFSKKISWAIFSLIFLFICISGIYIYSKVRHNTPDRTIAIIPLTNPPGDPELDRYAVGSMDAIITKLQEIKSLKVRGRLTSYYYLDTKKSPEELKKGLKSNYLVAINISRAGNDIKMWIGLNNTRTDEQLWSQKYDWNQDQLMPLFTKIVQTIAGNLNIKFTSEEIMNIEKDLTKSPEAYGDYLTASAVLITTMGNKFPDTSGFRSAIDYYDKAIENDPEFANAYARRAIALSWGIQYKELSPSNIEKCWSDINNASRINNNLSDVQIARGFYYYYCKQDYGNALINFNAASEKDPENYFPRFYMAMVNRAMGNWKEVKSLLNTVIKEEPHDPLVLTNIGLSFEYLHNFDSAMIYHQKAISVNPAFSAAYFNKFSTLLLTGKVAEARSVLDLMAKNSTINQVENRIQLDLLDGKYFEALTKAKISKSNDFTSKCGRSMCLGNISLLLNDKMSADKYFRNAIDELNLELKTDTADANIHGLIGLAMAGIGNSEALKEGEKAIAIARTNNNKILETDMIINLAEIYTKLGMFKEASELIDEKLRDPSFFSVKMLQLDPVWKPLMSSQEIKKIIAKYDKK
jgi:TolB-like protein/Tfp pilus assembly protein PilF